MDKSTKILCICNKGNCRSVGTRMCLNKRGYKNVIAIGGFNTSPKTMKMLCNWANKILLAKPEHIRFVPIPVVDIVNKFTIGEDIWHDPFNEELHKIIDEQLDKVGLT